MYEQKIQLAMRTGLPLNRITTLGIALLQVRRYSFILYHLALADLQIKQTIFHYQTKTNIYIKNKNYKVPTFTRV